MDEEKKKAVFRLLKEATPETGEKVTGTKVDIKGNNNIFGNENVQVNGNVSINKREVTTTKFTPDHRHITASQAKKLQDLVKKAVEIELAGSTSPEDSKKLFSKWWQILRDRYDRTTYLAIPAHLGEPAIAWLKQQIAILRPKLRRTNNTSWRKEHYTGIWARAKQLGISKGEVYAIVTDRIGKQVLSLTKLGEQDLKKLYNIIMAMR